MNYFNQLLELQKHSHAPFSNYKVASILVDKNNNIFKGVNVESSSLGLTICAERSALVSAITNNSHSFKELHLICSNKKSFGIPCGACLQMLADFFEDDTPIFIYNIEGKIKKYLFKELLPVCFRANYLLKE